MLFYVDHMDVDSVKKTIEFSFFPFFSAKQPNNHREKKNPAARTGAIAKVVSDTFQRNLR